jgi:large repetitive protein
MTRFFLTHKWIRHAFGLCLLATPFICLTSCDPADLDPVGNMERATTSNQAPNDTGTAESTEGNGTDTAPATAVCGNGVVETTAGETCDDGNTDPDDGCSADCQFEVAPDPICGNGVVETAAGEACDDGNTDPGDGCSAECQPETGTIAVCGNGILESGESCDDGNTLPNDGCTETCDAECGYLCATPGAPCELDCAKLAMFSCIVVQTAWATCCPDADTDTLLVDMCEAWYSDTDDSSICGNGILEMNEACDDGNTASDDGCSGDCQSVEDFF